MKRLLYQVCIGPKSKLYEYCTNSVKEYADRIGADYILQTQPILRITPNPFLNQREGKTGGWKKFGYMPIFEKENVFNYFNDYDQCCVIDADIYIKPDTPNIFDSFEKDVTVASIYECDLPLTQAYMDKIRSYSNMIRTFNMPWPHNSKTGFDFFNSGVMLYNSKKMLSLLNGMNPKQFLEQPMLENFINGIGPFKWQSDQITLNYWFAKKQVQVQRLDWKWNALYTAVIDNKINEGYFIHFFLKDHLPDKGENIKKLMEKFNV